MKAPQHALWITLGENTFPPDGLNLTLSPLSGLRDMVQLGLGAYESLLAMSMVTKEWVPSAIHNINGLPMAENRPFQTTDITLDGRDDENNIPTNS